MTFRVLSNGDIAELLVLASNTIPISTFNKTTENVRNMSITGMYWSGDWTVTRNSNVVIRVASSGAWPDRINLNTNSNTDIVCTLTGNGMLYLKLTKNTILPV